MSNELTAEEYLDTQLALGWDYIDIETAETYGDLRAKEAVEKFARELINESVTMDDEIGQTEAVAIPVIKYLAKQHGVDLSLNPPVKEPCDRCDGKQESECKVLCNDCYIDLHGM